MKKLSIITVSFLFCIQSYTQNWSQLQKIVASDRDTSDYFGNSVSISDNYAIVGAMWDDEDVTGGNTKFNAGSAYIFEKDSNGGWNQVQKIVPWDRDSADNFGYPVSISGNYAIIGAHLDDENSYGGNYLANSGSAYIFIRDSNGIWSQKQKIVASDRWVWDHFGNSVSISSNYAIVGASYESEDATGGNFMHESGSAYIFEKDSSGSWSQKQKIVASDRAAEDCFGGSVSISNNYAIVGAPYESEDVTGGNTMHYSGSSYLFERDTVGNWNQVQKIISSDRDAYDLFGFSVSISGNYTIVGSVGDGCPQPICLRGSAFIFERDSNGYWCHKQKVTCTPYNPMSELYFGGSVSINGNYAIVGADLKSHYQGGNSLPRSGSAYIFVRDLGGNWNQLQEIVASDCDAIDYFGTSVSISGGYAIVGANEEDHDALGGNPMNESGSAYIFEGIITNSVISPIACFRYTSPSGNFIWTNSGVYLDTIPNSVGGDSVITVILTIKEVDVSVTQSGITLKANATSAQYKWLDCNNGYAVIAGATSQTYTPTSNGSYAVEIKQNGCIDTSACYSITNIGVIENDFGPFLNVYPNPTTGEITIELGGIYIEVDIIVRNLIGQVILTRNFGTTNLVSFDIRGTKGFYFVELHTAEGKSAILRVFKE